MPSRIQSKRTVGSLGEAVQAPSVRQSRLESRRKRPTGASFMAAWFTAAADHATVFMKTAGDTARRFAHPVSSLNVDIQVDAGLRSVDYRRSTIAVVVRRSV